MTLVERFVEFKSWPASRKTALLSGLAVAFHLFGSLAADLAYSQLPWVNLPLINSLIWPWVFALALCFVVSSATAMRGYEGTWTIFLLVVPYGAFVAANMYLFGVASNAGFAWFPLVVLLFTLWYGPRTGAYSLFYWILLLTALSVVQSSTDFPFAPALLDRSVDVQRNLLWSSTVIFVVMLVFGFCFTLVVLILGARQIQQDKLDRSNRLMRRYVPSQLVEKIINGEHSEVFKPERVKLTIFFSDVEGFTEATDRMDAEELAELLNEYLSEMTQIAERYSATVSQFVGDGIMMFFGAPEATSDKDHAVRAVRMGIDMQKRLLALEDAWTLRGIEKPFRARIGINTGHASVGDYGSPGRKLYSAIGAQVNVTARIQARCEPGKLLISHTTWALVNDEISCTDMGEIQLKGLRHPVRVYEVSPGA